MKAFSLRLMIFLVINIAGIVASPESLYANDIKCNSISADIFSENLSLNCSLYLDASDEDGDLEKDMDHDGNFSKDLAGPSGFELEIMPFRDDNKYIANNIHSFYYKSGYFYPNLNYETPYLRCFHPPKIKQS